MAFKRLIAVVPMQNGQVVMSYGYTRYKPAGCIRSVLRNLDRWGVDEIVVIDISRGLQAPDFSLLEEVRRAGIRTPLAFGGGIRSAKHAVAAVSQGCDRVVIETLIWHAPNEVERISDAIGQQAVIGAVPVIYSDKGVFAAPVHKRTSEPWESCLQRLQDVAISELLVIDRAQEGTPGASQIAEHLPLSSPTQAHQFIWFGGLASNQAIELLSRSDTVGVAFGNPFLTTELAAHTLRLEMNSLVRAGLLREVRPHAGN